MSFPYRNPFPLSTLSLSSTHTVTLSPYRTRFLKTTIGMTYLQLCAQLHTNPLESDLQVVERFQIWMFLSLFFHLEMVTISEKSQIVPQFQLKIMEKLTIRQIWKKKFFLRPTYSVCVVCDAQFWRSTYSRPEYVIIIVTFKYSAETLRCLAERLIR